MRKSSQTELTIAFGYMYLNIGKTKGKEEGGTKKDSKLERKELIKF